MKKYFLFPACILLAVILAGCFNRSGSLTTVNQNKTNNQTNTAKEVVFKKAEDIEWVEADQSYVFTNTPTQITITSKIKENPNLIHENVYLYKCDADGNPAENLGRMFDDETHGDLLADNNRFTTQITFNEKEPKEIKLRLILSYTNTPQQFQSDMTAVQVKVKVDPEEIRTELINVLKTGSTEDIMKYFVPGEVVELAVPSLTLEQKNQFAEWVQKAELIKTTEKNRYYQYLLEAGGTVKFRMMLSPEGDWKFQF